MKKSSRRDLSIPRGPEAEFALFLCFFTKMFLWRFKKVDFLEVARGGVGGQGDTCWGGGGHFGLIVLRHTASLFCHQ